MKLELISTRKIESYPFSLFEGTFRDVEYDEEFFFYANINANVLDEEFENLDEIDLRVYAHSFENIHNCANFELTFNFDEKERNEFKKMLVEALKKKTPRIFVGDRYKLMSSYFCEGQGYDDKVFEARFEDTCQNGNEIKCYIFACISDFDTLDIKDGDVYIYAHSYGNTCNIEDYDITSNFSDEDIARFKEVLVNELRERMTI